MAPGFGGYAAIHGNVGGMNAHIAGFSGGGFHGGGGSR